jgi:sugar phosphate isomerase/epimerase
MKPTIALQLYTVRDPLAQDFEGTLAQVAKAGYKNVELAGLYNRTPQQVREILDKLKLKAVAAHLGLDLLSDKLDQTIAEAKVLGYTNLVLPWLGEEFRTPEGYAKAAKVLEAAGRKAADAGMTVCYHNHNFEFAKLADGSRGWDILYGKSDPKFVQSEMDLFWVTFAGEDPLKLMQQFTGRLPILHIKDMAAGPEKKMAEVGTGVIDYKAIVKAAPACGVKTYVIEQDNNWAGAPVASAKLSLSNLKKAIKPAPAPLGLAR